MKLIVATFVSLFICIMSFSQTVEYGYDACGNRITRQVVLQNFKKGLSVATPQNDFSEEKLGAVSVRIYPNPTQGRLKVTIQSPNKLQGSVDIFDTQGIRIFRQPNAVHENDIDLSSQPDGIYLMQLTIGTEMSTWKILKR